MTQHIPIQYMLTPQLEDVADRSFRIMVVVRTENKEKAVDKNYIVVVVFNRSDKQCACCLVHR